MLAMMEGAAPRGAFAGRPPRRHVPPVGMLPGMGFHARPPVSTMASLLSAHQGFDVLKAPAPQASSWVRPQAAAPDGRDGVLAS